MESLAYDSFQNKLETIQNDLNNYQFNLSNKVHNNMETKNVPISNQTQFSFVKISLIALLQLLLFLCKESLS